MWWRNPLRIAAVLALGALNAACFQPLYASRSVSGGTPLGTALAQIQLDPIPAANGTPEARIAVELQNQLDFELNGGGGLISPTHRLRLRMTTNRISIITDVNTGRVDGRSPGSMRIFTLIELATGKPVMAGRTFARVSSDYPGPAAALRPRQRRARRRRPRRQGDRREYPHAPRVVLRRRHLALPSWSR